MEKTASPELLEFRGQITAIKMDTVLLQKMILSEEEVEEENKILSKFNSVVEAQVFSTLINLSIYQLRGWREFIDD